MRRSFRFVATVCVGALLAAGCVAVPPPTARVASSAAAIRAAQELQAKETPSAQLRLQYAEDEYASAQKLIAAGENERAERMLQRAEADAELAVAIAKQVQSEKTAIAAQAEVQSVNSK